jgi:hypothetical protein
MMQLPATAEGRQGKCPSCDAVVTITAPQDTDRSASEVQVSTEQTTTAPSSPPQAAQHVQQQPAAVVAKPTPQPNSKPKKSRWKLLCVTHILAVALTIGLMPYWKPHLEPLFPDDYLVQNTSEADGMESQTLDEFGRAVLAAVQAKDPGPFIELGSFEYEDALWLNDRFLNAIEDPLKKARHESKKPAVTKKEVERGKTEWRRLVLEFFTLVENGEGVLTFEQLKKAKYLGMAGSERETESINEETGVSLDDIGVIVIDMPGIYIGVQGRVYLIGLNEVLMHLNGHWGLSGDIKMGLVFLFDRRFDMDEISFVGSLTGKREVFERMNRYLSDQPVPPQEHEQRIIDNRKPLERVRVVIPSSNPLVNRKAAPNDTPMMLPGMIAPVTLTATEAEVDAKELVIGITVGDVHRAYIVHAFAPWGQKVINDLINEIPITVTYCDIQERARVFTSTERGEYLQVGLGGWTNKEMFFYIDNIRFAQSSKNAPLPDYPYIITTWGEWLEVHPDSRIYLGDGVIPDDNLSFDADP